MKKYIRSSEDILDFTPGPGKNYCMDLCEVESFYFAADSPEDAVVKFLTEIMPEVTYEPNWKEDFVSDPEGYFALYGNIEYDENGDEYDRDVIYTSKQILKIAKAKGIIKPKRKRSKPIPAEHTLSYAEVCDKLKKLSSTEERFWFIKDSSIPSRLSDYSIDNQFTEHRLADAIRAILIDDGYSAFESTFAGSSTAINVFKE